MSNTPPSPNISRRAFFRLGGSVAAAGLGASASASASPAPDNAITRENALPGVRDWQLTYARIDPDTKYRSPWIEGFCSKASVMAGETLDIMVSTNPAKSFTLDIYRMGYYGGLGARHMGHYGPFEGSVQPEPEIGFERLRECKWSPSMSLTIPADWISGVYLGKLTSAGVNGYQSYVVFIVRDERKADIVFQCSDNTWQAYNRWPSQYSLYDNAETEWALKPNIRVSYDRPYGKYCQVTDTPMSQGSGEFLLWEFPLAYWLEQHGYDVTYISNTDTDASAATVLRGKSFLSVGHDEYWSLEQYAHVKEGIDAGVNVAFLSGDTCCFVTPQLPSTDGRPRRVLTRMGMFGGVREDEAPRMGPFPMEGPDESLLIGGRTIMPFNGAGDWIVETPEHWLFDGTGMSKGEGIPGLVGWEFHGDPPKLPGLEVLAKGDSYNSGGEVAHWSATMYPGPKGNWVFNASTIFWAQGLSQPPGHTYPYAHYGRPHGPDPRVQKMTENLLKKFIG